MADNPQTEVARKRLADEQKVRERSAAEFAEVAKGKPTPTQQENDLIKLGAVLDEKEDDGSGPQPEFRVTRHVEAAPPKQPQTYQTRQATPSQPTPSKPAGSST